MKVLPWALLICAAWPAAGALPEPENDWGVPVEFTCTWDVGTGRSVYVVGNCDALGQWTPTGAVKLAETAPHAWAGTIAVPAGTALEYKYVARFNFSSNWCDGANIEWSPGPNLATNLAPAPAAPYPGKTLYYHSAWTSAAVIFRVGTNWYSQDMTCLGAGRTSTEFLYRAGGIGVAGADLEFVPCGYLNHTQYWDHAPYGDHGGNYYSPLDFMFLQDGNVFNYPPPPTLSTSRIAIAWVHSDWEDYVTSRYVRIYLPRGYDQNTWKRYPVLYMHDGQNDFYPGGTYGSWDADLTATREISQGRMRETIIVGVDNSDKRSWEYNVPPTFYANYYANFLAHNVKPMIDAQYRTLGDYANTATLGSSYGGVVSLYLGLFTNVFQKIGAFSTYCGVSWSMLDWANSNDTRGLRIYLDSGTEEADLTYTLWPFYDSFLKAGYTVHRDLRWEIGCGHVHNEWSWALRLPCAYQFLLNLRDEPNRLAYAAQDLRLTNAAIQAAQDGLSVQVPGLQGYQYRLEQNAVVSNAMGWTAAATSGVVVLPWSSALLAATNPANRIQFYRVVAEPK